MRYRIAKRGEIRRSINSKMNGVIIIAGREFLSARELKQAAEYKTVVYRNKYKIGSCLSDNGFTKGTLKTRWENRTRVKSRTSPDKYFTQNIFADVTGWVRRKDFVFLMNSFVNGRVPNSRLKRMGSTKWAEGFA